VSKHFLLLNRYGPSDKDDLLNFLRTRTSKDKYIWINLKLERSKYSNPLRTRSLCLQIYCMPTRILKPTHGSVCVCVCVCTRVYIYNNNNNIKVFLCRNTLSCVLCDAAWRRLSIWLCFVVTPVSRLLKYHLLITCFRCCKRHHPPEQTAYSFSRAPCS
jgi:hypothetical protein